MSCRIFTAGLMVFCGLLLVSCKPKADTIPISINGHVLNVEVAKTPAERERGLMDRISMAENHGMLFIFPNDQHLSFWMKNTDIPLAIAYISLDGTIREIYHMKPHSLEAIQSDHSVRYALEVNDGEFARLGVKPGDRVEFPSNLPTATQ
ncbi:MAG TPA: DUF192 domain-containing protein [Spirochaetia bacterium]|nr:DUF192 domain-containing protein [Spirochaetia bacterium]